MSQAEEVKESVEVAGSADDVWEVIGDFGRVAEWHPGVTGCRLEAGGRVRHVQIGTGLTLVHTLDDRDDETRTLSYSVGDGRVPVDNMRVTIRVREIDRGCAVDVEVSMVPLLSGAPRMARAFWRAALDSLVRRFGSVTVRG